MKTSATILAAALLVGAFAAAPAAAQVRSTTYIEAGQTFLLGGGQKGTFRVDGVNRGRAPVTVLVQPEAGPPRVIARAAPGERVDLVFAPGETAQFRNDGQTRATMGFLLTRDVQGLAMRYQGADD